MTKEELIALSDLNREDNIKYISSEAQGIAIALDSNRYAPTLCKLERAYICGRRKNEEQIAELGERCLQLQTDKGNLTDRVRELEAQIEKMKCCYNCKHSRTDYVHCITNKHEKWEMIKK